MPRKPWTKIGEQAETVLLQCINSIPPKELSLEKIKSRIDWSYQHENGNFLTEKQVRNRLAHLRKLDREDRQEFLEICLKNQKVDINWERFEAEGEQQQQEKESNDTPSNDTPSNDTPSNDTPSNDTPSNDTPSNDTPSGDTPSNSSSNLKRNHDIMVSETKKAKVIDPDLAKSLGLPKGTPVIEYDADGDTMRFGNIAILPAVNELPGIDQTYGVKTRNSGFVINYLIQSPEMFENRGLGYDYIGAQVINGDKVLIWSVVRTIFLCSCFLLAATKLLFANLQKAPFGIYYDTEEWNKGLPQNKKYLRKIYHQANSKIITKKETMRTQYLLIDFCGIPLSASPLTANASGGDDERLSLLLHEYENTSKSIMTTKFNCPIEHWAIWEVARTDMESTVQEPLKVKTKKKTSEFEAFLDATDDDEQDEGMSNENDMLITYNCDD